MCTACELNFWAMIDALPEADRERILREQFGDAAFEAAQAEVKASPFVCEPFNDGTPDAASPEGERKP